MSTNRPSELRPSLSPSRAGCIALGTASCTGLSGDSWEPGDTGGRGPTLAERLALVEGSCWLGSSMANMGISHSGSCVGVTTPRTPESVTVEGSHLSVSTSSAWSSVGTECLPVVLLFRWAFLLPFLSAFTSAYSLSDPSTIGAPPSSGRQTGW